MWQRLSEILSSWYEQILKEAKGSPYLHADETGWRVNGITHWLWCFTHPRLTCYLIHRSRGSPVLAEFLGELFEGILISDFWSAYNKLEAAARQVCFAHLFRELETVGNVNSPAEGLAFRKKITRFLRDVLCLDKQEAFEEPVRTSRLLRLDQRLDQIPTAPCTEPDCKRLVARLTKHREDILTFPEADIPADNNHAEREIPRLCSSGKTLSGTAPSGVPPYRLFS